MAQYRSEWKYICTDGQLELIRARLSGILAPDSHAGSDGSYTVCILTIIGIPAQQGMNPVTVSVINTASDITEIQQSLYISNGN